MAVLKKILRVFSVRRLIQNVVNFQGLLDVQVFEGPSTEDLIKLINITAT